MVATRELRIVYELHRHTWKQDNYGKDDTIREWRRLMKDTLIVLALLFLVGQIGAFLRLLSERVKHLKGLWGKMFRSQFNRE